MKENRKRCQDNQWKSLKNARKWQRWYCYKYYAISDEMKDIHQACDFSGFFPDFMFFFTNLPLPQKEKRSSHQGKNVQVTCIVSKPLVSCLWGCGESVNPTKLNIQEVQMGFVLSTKVGNTCSFYIMMMKRRWYMLPSPPPPPPTEWYWIKDGVRRLIHN